MAIKENIMENRILPMKGNVSAEINADEKIIYFSEHGEHVFKLSFDEIEDLHVESVDHLAHCVYEKIKT